jgi:hypothetical protein
VNAFVGGLMILAGWLLAMWTIYNAPVVHNSSSAASLLTPPNDSTV